MNRIHQLDQVTIDKIAAGEVIERPASIVKELVENAIDAQASSITVEIEQGGIALIRISDNGSGITKEDIRSAFLRHSTSKLRDSADLETISTLGFRGEALSSIAAVSKLELKTKTREDVFGSCFKIDGGVEQSLFDDAASDGCTFFIRDMFYNVPARKKFLKSASTEAGQIQDLLFRMALSHPEVQFHFINNGKKKLATAGNGELIDVIYRIYGREITTQLLELTCDLDGVSLHGYIGKPNITKGNRSYQTFFVNGRYIRSSILSKAVEDAYAEYRMLHRFPFVVLNLNVNPTIVDVNVHPTKMELRFEDNQRIYQIVFNSVRRVLSERDLIPSMADTKSMFSLSKTAITHTKATHEIPDQYVIKKKQDVSEKQVMPEQKAVSNQQVISERHVSTSPKTVIVKDEAYFLKRMRERVQAYHDLKNKQSEQSSSLPTVSDVSSVIKTDSKIKQEFTQVNLQHLMEEDIKHKVHIVGQIFRTYWLVTMDQTLYIVDQHAAHEKILYERILQQIQEREVTSQIVSPPIVLNLSMKEADLLRTYLFTFQTIGFEIEEFGGESFAVRAVPENLLSIQKKELLHAMIDELSEQVLTSVTPDLILEKVAMLSCKGAVKGNQILTHQEMERLLTDLFALKQPYQCPHGRPTMISMTQYELEKKFKRVV